MAGRSSGLWQVHPGPETACVPARGPGRLRSASGMFPDCGLGPARTDHWSILIREDLATPPPSTQGAARQLKRTLERWSQKGRRRVRAITYGNEGRSLVLPAQTTRNLHHPARRRTAQHPDMSQTGRGPRRWQRGAPPPPPARGRNRATCAARLRSGRAQAATVRSSVISALSTLDTGQPSLAAAAISRT